VQRPGPGAALPAGGAPAGLMDFAAPELQRQLDALRNQVQKAPTPDPDSDPALTLTLEAHWQTSVNLQQRLAVGNGCVCNKRTSVWQRHSLAHVCRLVSLLHRRH
jgi:hypothetical protein